MNLLEMFKNLTKDEKQEFIEMLINEINKKTTIQGSHSITL